MTAAPPRDEQVEVARNDTDRMWTSRLRRGFFDRLPPDKLLPDEQPAYVSSWIYVFGVLTIAALAVIIASGCVLAFEGPQWYHTSDAGRFFNSLHFWSVQLFFVAMVIHLWGKFWMAAWRGRRVATWVTGAIAFLASIATAFTGYLMQTNFDSQWIAAEAKDGLNSVGIGAWFNALDFGQAMLIHVILLPFVLGLIVVWHVLLVRHRGVVPPLEPAVGASDKGMIKGAEAEPWRGRMRRYDLVKEFVVGLTVISVLTLGLSALFSSPDVKSIRLQDWASAAPSDFVATASAELDGSSGTAGYGAPYVDISGAGQHMGPIRLQEWAGVRIPVNAAQDFVIGPLRTVPSPSATLRDALTSWSSATSRQQVAWASAYTEALGTAPDGDPAKVEPGDYGPVPALTSALLRQARSGALDGALALGSRFYQTNYTKSVLFLADGTYLEDKARAEHLGGDQSGMMNETGSYPGQEWLWLYTFWYQIKPFSDESNAWGANADAIIWTIVMLLSLGLVLLPYIPGLRSIPRWVPVHRLIWRQWYAEQGKGPRAPPAP
jgi:Cytochrome b(N-terminal)/b6/petB